MSWGGRRAREAVDGPPMAPQMGVSSQLLSVSNEHMGERFGWEGVVPGQQLVWSVVSAASLVEGA